MLLNGGKAKKKVKKMVVSFMCEGSSRIFRTSELLLACAGRHIEMLSVEAGKEKSKTGPQRKSCKDLGKPQTSLELPI